MGALRKKLLFTGIFAGNGSRKSRKEGREVHIDYSGQLAHALKRVQRMGSAV